MSTSSDIVKTLKKNDKLKLDVSLLSDDDSPCIVKDWLPTGCLVLDAIMGGGLPLGRMVEIFGEYSSGKSLIAGQVVAMAQQSNILVVYADTEGTVSIDMMEKVGVDIAELIYSAPDTIEETFTLFEQVLDEKKRIDKDAKVLLVWDSIAASSAKFEQAAEYEYGKSSMGRHAQIMSASLRKFIHRITTENVYALFLNQTRQKIGVMFGDSTTTSGGVAVGFYASIRIRLDLEAKLKAPNKKGKTRIVGMNTRANCIKNKVAMPFKSALLPIYFGHGIDDAKSTFNYLVDNSIIEQSGAQYTLELGGEKLKFMKKSFDGIFDKHYDAIADIMFAMDEDTGDVKEAQPEEAE